MCRITGWPISVQLQRYVCHLTGNRPLISVRRRTSAVRSDTARCVGQPDQRHHASGLSLATSVGNITQFVLVKGLNAVETSIPPAALGSGSGTASLTADGLVQLRAKQLYAELKYQGVVIRGQCVRLMCPAPTGGSVPGICTQLTQSCIVCSLLTRAAFYRPRCQRQPWRQRRWWRQR